MRFLSRIAAVFLSSLLLGGPGFALPWYMQDQERQQHLQDPDEFSRTRTNPIKAQDLQSHKDNIQKARDLLFDGGLPTKAVLKVGQTDPATGETPIEVTATFGDFSDSVKSEILTQLGPGVDAAAINDETVVVVGTLTSEKSLEVTSAKLGGADALKVPTMNVPGLAHSPAPNIPGPQIQTPAVQPGTVRPTGEPNAQMPAPRTMQTQGSADQPLLQTQPTQTEPVAPPAQIQSAATAPLTRVEGTMRTTLPPSAGNQSDVTTVARAIAQSFGISPNAVDISIPSSVGE